MRSTRKAVSVCSTPATASAPRTAARWRSAAQATTHPVDDQQDGDKQLDDEDGAEQAGG